MDLIKTGFGLGRTIQNLSRTREILSVFAKNGFDEFIIKSSLHQVIPGFAIPKARIEKALSELENSQGYHHALGYRMRLSFEELGTSFIKLGQLLSTREDIFPEDFITEMKMLLSNAQPMSFETAREIIEESMGSKIEEKFSFVNPQPIGSASIGSVFEAVLLTGEKVVIKVQKKGIKKQIKTDFEILHFIVNQLEKVVPDLKYLGIKRLLIEFHKSLNLELNFLLEAMNCERMGRNIAKHGADDLFIVPKIYKEYSSAEVLVLEKFSGSSFEKVNFDDPTLPVKKEEIVQRSVFMFVQSLLADGFYHADLHSGNFFLLDSGKVGIIDFGLMGTMGKRSREKLIGILYSLVRYDYTNLVYELLDVAEYDEMPDDEELIRDVQDALSAFIGLDVEDVNINDLFNTIFKTLAKHRLYLPNEWFTLVRALVTVDGVGKALDIKINIFEVLSQDLGKIIANNFSTDHIKNEMMWVSKDMTELLRILPRHLRWSLRHLAKNKYALEFSLKDQDNVLQRISRTFIFLGFSFLIGIFTLVGALMIQSGNIDSVSNIPLISWIFWAFALLLAIRSLFLFR